MIKHISLDLWNTLLVSNNKFSIDRINYFHNNYFIKSLYLNALNNNYDKISDYKKNFHKLGNLILKQ